MDGHISEMFGVVWQVLWSHSYILPFYLCSHVVLASQVVKSLYYCLFGVFPTDKLFFFFFFNYEHYKGSAFKTRKNIPPGTETVKVHPFCRVGSDYILLPLLLSYGGKLSCA